MTLHPRLSRAAVTLVKQFEGLRRTAARLESGGWTIGYGHTASAREGASVDEAQAEALLFYDLDKVARLVDEATFTPLNDNQFAALTAFAFNVGDEAFRGSDVLKRVNEGAYLQAAAALELWRRSQFRGEPLVVDALVRRRAAEKLLFLTPPEGFRPVPTAVAPPEFDPGATDLAAQAEALADAAHLHVPLDGEAVLSERVAEPPPEPTATVIAAESITARLQKLFAEEPPAPPEPEPEPQPAAADHEPPPFPDAGAEPPLEPQAPEQAETGPQDSEPPVVQSEPAPPADAGPEFIEAVEPPPMPSPEMLSPPAGAFGRRSVAGYEPPLIPALPLEMADDRWAALRAPLILAAGAVGLLMFLGSLWAMIYGRSTGLNLVIGLIGVVLMAPAGARLVSRFFGARDLDSED